MDFLKDFLFCMTSCADQYMRPLSLLAPHTQGFEEVHPGWEFPDLLPHGYTSSKKICPRQAGTPLRLTAQLIHANKALQRQVFCGVKPPHSGASPTFNAWLQNGMLP